MTAPVKPAKIRQARAYLQNAGVRTADISPQHFAQVAEEHGMTFQQALNYLALLLSGGSGNGPSPITTAGEDRLDPIRALAHQTPDQAAEYASASGQ